MPDDPKPGDGTPNPSPEGQPKESPKPPAGDPAPKAEAEPKVDDKPKDEGGKPKADSGDPAVKPRAPEKYELKSPEGNRLTADELRQVEEVARANDWTQDEAQAEIEAIDAARRETSERFYAELKADPTYGGENLAVTEKNANAVLDRVWPKGTAHGDFVRGLLHRTGIFNNVHVIRGLSELGRAIGEDPGPGGGTGAGKGAADNKPLTSEVAASKLYGKR